MPSAVVGSAANPSQTPFVDTGFASTTFLIVCSALVMIMVPGVGLLYSGLSSTKNALSIIMLSMLTYAIVTLQWVLFGFSLAFAENGSPFIGTLSWGGFTQVGSQAMPLTAPQVPAIAYGLYQLQFAAVTAAVIFGATTERIRLVPACIFIFIWTTLVYDPIAYWTWAARGWLKNLACLDTTALLETPCGMGVLDFAGGGPVEMASGFSGLAYCIMLGQRRGKALAKPHNLTFVFIGTGLLWFGWLGFNGASAVGATPRAAMACMVTNVAGAAGALTWVFIDQIKNRKLSGVGFCSGALAGLVAITPASGYVAPWAAIVIGIVASIVCEFAVSSKEFLGVDDALDVFGLHGVGGIIGTLFTGLFAQKWVAALDGTVINGGAIEGNWIQVGYQLAAIVVVCAYAFFGSLLILFVINKIPGLHLRTDPHEEEMGGDLGEMGETAYEFIGASNLADMDMTKEILA